MENVLSTWSKIGIIQHRYQSKRSLSISEPVSMKNTEKKGFSLPAYIFLRVMGPRQVQNCWTEFLCFDFWMHFSISVNGLDNTGKMLRIFKDLILNI